MLRKPDVSIVTPVFNEAPFIGEMIQSVKAQSFSDWELLIIDDESTDHTVQVATEAARGEPRVHIHSGMGKLGKVRAFNYGFQASHGKYIVLLGGDDTLPKSSLKDRVEAIRDCTDPRACGYFRLRTMSTDPRHDGIVIPKGNSGNRSGGTMIATRELAYELFPIPEELVAEDVWLAEIARMRAGQIVDNPAVVLNYRIHPGNSNPRSQAFDRMSESIHKRMRPYEILLQNCPDMDSDRRRQLEAKVRLEDARYRRGLIGVLTVRDTGFVDRLRGLSMASPVLFGLRNRFFRLFSGWR